MTGLITDPSGAAIQRARITLTNEGTHAIRKITSDNNGVYNVPHVPPGTYTMAVDAPGFKHYEKMGIDVSSAQTLAFDAHLQMGSASQSVIVSGRSFVADASSVGSKTNLPLIQVPQSVSVETRDELTAQNAEDLGSALRYVAGVNGEVYGGNDQRVDYYVVRGFTDTFALIDGMPSYTYYTLLSPKLEVFDAERIEVLRGPSSSLYGQTTPGGVINFVTKRPQALPIRSLSIETGSFGRKQGSGDFSGAFDKGQHFLYRLTGFARNSGTQIQHVDNNRYLLAPALTWQPTNKTSLTLLTHLSYVDGGWTLQYLPNTGTLTPTQFGIISRRLFTGDLSYNKDNRKEFTETGIFDHHFSDTLHSEVSARSTQTSVDIEDLTGAGLESDGHTLDRYAFGAKAQMNQFVSDGHLDWTSHRGHLRQTLLAGYNYMQSNDTWNEIDGSDSVPLDLLNPNYRQTFTLPAPDFISADGIKQTGVYMQDAVEWRKLTLLLNGREDWARSFSTDYPDTTPSVQTPSKFTYRTGLSYAATESVVPYFSYTTSFQPTSGTTFAGEVFKPLTAQQYEAGMRYQPTSFQALFSAAVYSLTEQNVTTIDPAHPNYQVQRGEVRSQGLELEAKTSLPGGLDGTASYTYTSPEITKSFDIDLHKAPLNTPRNMANLWLDKTLQTGRWKNLGAGGGVRFLGKRWGDQYNTLQVPNNTLVDLMAHYSFSKWKISANATNLADRRYVATCETQYAVCMDRAEQSLPT